MVIHILVQALLGRSEVASLNFEALGGGSGG